jgi:hypothetical protein
MRFEAGENCVTSNRSTSGFCSDIVELKDSG